MKTHSGGTTNVLCKMMKALFYLYLLLIHNSCFPFHFRKNNCSTLIYKKIYVFHSHAFFIGIENIKYYSDKVKI